MRLCLIYNYAQHYRSSIFQYIDRTYDCDFFFGKDYLDIKKMDYSLLKGKVTEIDTLRLGALSYKKGILRQLRKGYTHFVLLGETHDLSIWLFCLLSRFFYRKKVFLWTHGWYGKESKMEQILKKVLYRLPNGGLLLYGNYAKSLMVDEGFNPKKLFVIHNSLSYEEQLKIRECLVRTDVYEKHFGNRNAVLVFVGRLTQIKRLDLLISALKACKERGNVYNLILIGGGEMKEHLASLVHEAQMEDNIWFYGPCYDEHELSSLIYNADVCVSPGNVGLTAIHAMTYGTPVITHDYFPYQMPEFEAIHDGETGAFFHYNDDRSLSLAIDNWINSQGNSREMVRNACFKEIDNNWTPQFQMDVLRSVLV